MEIIRKPQPIPRPSTLFGSCRMVLNHWFPLSNRNSLNVASARRFQGLARSPSQPIWLRSSINSFNSDPFLRDGRWYIFQWDWDQLNLIFLLCLRHFSTRTQALNLLRILSPKPYHCNHYRSGRSGTDSFSTAFLGQSPVRPKYPF